MRKKSVPLSKSLRTYVPKALHQSAFVAIPTTVSSCNFNLDTLSTRKETKTPPPSCVYPPPQYSALENQMGEERRSREGKLRDRLEKKRGAKQEEIKKAALSAEVKPH